MLGIGGGGAGLWRPAGGHEERPELCPFYYSDNDWYRHLSQMKLPVHVEISNLCSVAHGMRVFNTRLYFYHSEDSLWCNSPQPLPTLTLKPIPTLKPALEIVISSQNVLTLQVSYVSRAGTHTWKRMTLKLDLLPREQDKRKLGHNIFFYHKFPLLVCLILALLNLTLVQVLARRTTNDNPVESFLRKHLARLN